MRAGFAKIKPECKACRADLPVFEANISANKISLLQEVILLAEIFFMLFRIASQPSL